VTKPRKDPAAPARHSAAPGALILIVDDFEDNRAMYAQFLTFSGFRVAEASNGKEALEKAGDLLPDLIVMDLSLPVMDGWEATRRLKSDERTRRIPVLALTGHALGRHSEGAREAGCDGVVTKPCLPEDLIVEIRRMLEGGPTRARRKGGP
jgi:two-component system cell cycle response regulator DivK